VGFLPLLRRASHPPAFTEQGSKNAAHGSTTTFVDGGMMALGARGGVTGEVIKGRVCLEIMERGR
jgi:hypothetical protein